MLCIITIASNMQKIEKIGQKGKEVVLESRKLKIFDLFYRIEFV